MNEDLDFQSLIDLVSTGDSTAIWLAVITGAVMLGLFFAKKSETKTDDAILTKVLNVLKKLTIKKDK